jgi:hypothetical protein
MGDGNGLGDDGIELGELEDDSDCENESGDYLIP